MLTKANAPKPKPVREPKAKKLTAPKRRKLLEKEVEALMRELVWWRDGSRCVLAEIDGKKCGNGIQWGHFIPRSRSAYMVYILGNSFCQCGNHNLMHKHEDPVFGVWYSGTFGQAASEAILADVRAHAGKKPAEWELQEWIDELRSLLDDRPAVHTLELLIERGYYGSWPKENAK